jgi:ankyrin repeat protein
MPTKKKKTIFTVEGVPAPFCGHCLRELLRLQLLVVFLGLFLTTLSGCTPLEDAARRGDSQRVRALLDQGDTRGMDQALFYAACLDHIEVAQLLLERGENPNPRQGMSPLHCAIREENPAMVSLLLKYGADPDYKSGMPSPRKWAERKGNTTILELLRDAQPTRPATSARPPVTVPTTPATPPPPIY